MTTLNFKVLVMLCLFLTFTAQAQEKPLIKNLSSVLPSIEVQDLEFFSALKETEIQSLNHSELNESMEVKIQNGFFQLGGNLTALNQALCFHEKNKNRILKPNGDPSKTKGITFSDSKYLIIFDLTKSSRLPRLFFINLQTGEVEVTTVAHGRGKDKQEIENKEFAKYLSNKAQSFLSSHGWFITGEKYALKNQNWKYGIHLYGLQQGVNNNVFSREVIMHPDPGVQGQLYSSAFGDDISKISIGIIQPRSWGCLMLPPAVAADVIERVQMSKGTNQGTLLYGFSSIEEQLGSSYCGE